MKKIFISCSSLDKDIANEYETRLLEFSYSVSTGASISPGGNFADELRNEIDKADFIIVLLTNNYLSSSWLDSTMEGILLSGNSDKLVIVKDKMTKLPQSMMHIQFLAVDSVASPNDDILNKLLLFFKNQVRYFYDLSIIEFLNKLALRGEYVFRGYSIQEQMIPSVLRNKATDIEFVLLRDFERYGAQYFSVSNHIDLVSYAQHYGLSTRLLDFTYNPFIALYFALFKSKSNNATVVEDRDYYYIRYANISENDLKQEVSYPVYGALHGAQSESDSLALKFENSVNQVLSTYSKSDDPKILFIDPNQANQRMVMQQGLFMLPYTLDENEHIELIERKTSVIKIHKDLRFQLQSYLSTIGMDAFRLMPDLSSVCEAIERKAREKRNEKSQLFKKSSSASKTEQLQELSDHLARSIKCPRCGKSELRYDKPVDTILSLKCAKCSCFYGANLLTGKTWMHKAGASKTTR